MILDDFLALAATPYHAMPATDEHEREHNMGNKKRWGFLGGQALRRLARDCQALPVSIRHNPSGSIDRGYISGFLSNQDGSKHVYVSINDGMGDILFRTAKSPSDYTGGPNNMAPISSDGFDRLKQFIHQNI